MLWSWHPDQVPLDILIDSNVDPDYAPLVRDAIHYWNEQVGCRVFNEIGELSNGGTVTFSALTVISPSILYAYVSKAGSSAVVWIQKPEDIQYHDRVIRHELGHVLGLAHDEDKTSLMYERVGIQPYSILDRDRQLVHDLYCTPLRDPL